MSDQIRVNGNQLSWGSISFYLNGDLYTGFTAISYGDKRERVKAWGMGRHHAPRGRSSGKYTPDNVKVTGWKASVQTFLQALALQSGTPTYGSTQFEIVVLYSEFTDLNVTVEINECLVTAVTASDEESPDPLKEDLEIDCMAISRNGLVLFDPIL